MRRTRRLLRMSVRLVHFVNDEGYPNDRREFEPHRRTSLRR